MLQTSAVWRQSSIGSSHKHVGQYHQRRCRQRYRIVMTINERSHQLKVTLYGMARQLNLPRNKFLGICNAESCLHCPGHNWRILPVGRRWGKLVVRRGTISPPLPIWGLGYASRKKIEKINVEIVHFLSQKCALSTAIFF